MRTPCASPIARRVGQRGALAVLGGPVLAHAVDGDRAAERSEPLGERPPEPRPAPVTRAT